MFLRIVGARSAEQFDIIDIIEVKIPFTSTSLFGSVTEERKHNNEDIYRF